MKRTGILIQIVLFFFSSNSYSADFGNQNSFHLGLTGGISQNNFMSGDVFGGLIFPMNSNTVESNIGYTYFYNKTDFDHVKDLFYKSHGIFGEINCFLNSKIYVGARASINMNFVDEESQNKYSQNIIHYMRYMGMIIYG
jgi:hypothetical protein